MTTKFNSGTRLYNILQHVRARHSDNSSCYNIWAQILDIDLNDHNGYFMVSEKLLEIHYEAINFENQLKEKGYDIALINETIPQIHAAVKFGFGANWSRVRQVLTDEVIINLRNMKEFIGNDENEIDPKDLSEILKLVNELESFVNDSKLSQNLKSVLYQNIHRMKSVISNYSIRGSRHFVASFDFHFVYFMQGKDFKRKNKELIEKVKVIFINYTNIARNINTWTALGSNAIKAIVWLGK